MTRIRTKVPKGNIMYKFRGSNYLTQPDNTYISRMYYYPEENNTEIYLRRHSFVLEVILVLLILCVLAFNAIYPYNDKQMFYYNSTVVQYNDKLYLNLKNDTTSLFPVEVNIIIDDNVVFTAYLNPGDEYLTVDYSGMATSLYLDIEYKFPLFPKEEQVQCFIARKD